MQLYSKELELKCIKTLTNPKIPEKIRSTLLGKLSKDFFHFPPTKAAFNRINVIAKKRFNVVSLGDLVNDPALEEDFRERLKESDTGSCRGKRDMKSMLDNMDNFRKLRIMYNSANDIIEQIESESVDIDKLLDVASDAIVHARKDLEEEDAFVVVGENSNADELVHDVLHKVAEELIKTGFIKYDDRNGGVPTEGVMLLAATTSGGKSTMLMNLLKNMYEQSHKRVCRVSLEMGDKQEMSRLLSNISGVPFSRIKQNKLSPKEKQRILKAYEAFKEVGEEHSCVFNSVSPTKSMTIDDVLRMVKPYQYEVIGIDYVSLLEEENTKDQWKNLSNIVKQCKIFSRENKCLVVVLCQLDDESERLRYSKGMKEHADVMWSWNYSKKEQRELRVLPINTDKARDAELIRFDLAERFDIMQTNNMLEDEDDYASDEDDVADTSETATEDDSEENKQMDDYALS